MENNKLRCYSCGGLFEREQLQFRPSGRGAYRRELYFCPLCDEKQKKKSILKAAGSAYRKTISTRSGYRNLKR
ncbi:hypothetical protein QFL30_003468 [Klebsiella oxytoca]|nr:hypothetical protein [Klebsiella oxytoca]